MPGEPVQQLLAAPDRERRDADIALVAPRGFEYPAKLADRFRAVLVVAVAVGRLHHHHVGMRDRFGIAQDRRAIRAEIAGKHQRAIVAVQFDDGRTEDVSGIAQCHFHTGKNRRPRVVWQRLDQPDCGVDVVAGVEREDFRLALAAVAIGAFGVVLGQRRRVEQHDRHQLRRRALREDRSGEAALHQQGHAPDVVDVRMADDQGVQARRIERKRVEIPRLGMAVALDHPAVQQHPLASHFDLVHRAGDLARRPVESNAHMLSAGREWRGFVTIRTLARRFPGLARQAGEEFISPAA